MSFELPSKYADDLIQCLLEERVGSGAAREVWKLRGVPYVAKIEHGQSFQNVLEWSLWNDSEGTSLREWLAPCLTISANGAVLIQAETTQPFGIELPARVPAVLYDLKVQNFGLYQSKLVAHDYGLSGAMEFGARSKKMRDAKWWDGSRGRYLKGDCPIT